MLDKESKEELLRLAYSLELRKDFEIMRENSRRFKKNVNIDDYIKFLNFINNMAGHPLKPFMRISGSDWKI